MSKRVCAICGFEIEDNLDVGVFPKAGEVAHNVCFQELIDKLTSGQYSESDLSLFYRLGFGGIKADGNEQPETIH